MKNFLIRLILFIPMLILGCIEAFLEGVEWWKDTLITYWCNDDWLI